jgi:hypothetical protein
MYTGQDDAAGHFVAAFGHEGLVAGGRKGRLARTESSQ